MEGNTKLNKFTRKLFQLKISISMFENIFVIVLKTLKNLLFSKHLESQSNDRKITLRKHEKINSNLTRAFIASLVKDGSISKASKPNSSSSKCSLGSEAISNGSPTIFIAIATF